MPIFGRSKRTNDDDLHEMSEVSFNVPLNDLRRIARFLNEFANQVEARTTLSDHLHLTQFDRTWSVDHPDSDVIAIDPSLAPQDS